jgi:hypothetical protein
MLAPPLKDKKRKAKKPKDKTLNFSLFMIHLSPEEMAQVQDNIGEMTLADYL